MTYFNELKDHLASRSATQILTRLLVVVLVSGAFTGALALMLASHDAETAPIVHQYMRAGIPERLATQVADDEVFQTDIARRSTEQLTTALEMLGTENRTESLDRRTARVRLRTLLRETEQAQATERRLYPKGRVRPDDGGWVGGAIF